MNKRKLKKTLKKIRKDLNILSVEEFRKMLDKHKDGSIACLMKDVFTFNNEIVEALEKKVDELYSIILYLDPSFNHEMKEIILEEIEKDRNSQ